MENRSQSALYQRLAARRGKKRAIMAVAHAIVVSAFHMLARHEAYHELGYNYLDEQRTINIARRGAPDMKGMAI